MTSLSFCRFRFIPKCEFIILEVWIRTRHWKTLNFVVKSQVMLHQFSTIRALLLSIFTRDNAICMTYCLKNPNPHDVVFKIRIQKQMGGTGLWYCKVSHVVFIILVVQIFCLKCIYHFAGLLFSYLSFCRVTLLNIQKSYHFPGFSFSRFVFLLFRPLEFIIFLRNHFPG